MWALITTYSHQRLAVAFCYEEDLRAPRWLETAPRGLPLFASHVAPSSSSAAAGTS